MNSCNRLHRMCQTDRLRHSKITHFTLSDQFPDRARDVLNQHIWVDTVLVIEVEMIGPGAL